MDTKEISPRLGFAVAGIALIGLVVGIIVLRSPGQPSVLATSTSPAVSEPRTPCSNGPQLSFVATDTGREQIYLLESHRSSSIIPIRSLPGFVEDPAWSPDGLHVAFRWYRPGRDAPDVFMANADGSDLKVVMRDAAMPAWSPNGKLIAFANLRLDSRGISIVDVDEALRGMHAVRVVTRTDDSVPEELPAWSPDGGRIAFTSQRDGNSDIWTVDVDGTHLRNLTSKDLSLDSDPTWSPRGGFIAFGSNRESSSEGGGDIYVMRADGSDVQRLTFGDSAYAPAWSPDDCGIAFNSLRSGTSEIYVMRSDGSDISPVTSARPEPSGELASACCAAWRQAR
jgi:Tol biopolymer transport system component